VTESTDPTPARHTSRPLPASTAATLKPSPAISSTMNTDPAPSTNARLAGRASPAAASAMVRVHRCTPVVTSRPVYVVWPPTRTTPSATAAGAPATAFRRF
jgi:hypothetical protein